MTEIDWRDILFESKLEIGANKVVLFKLLEKRALKRFGWDRTLADEAFNAVLDAVSGNNFARLAGFDGRGKPQSYLISVFANALEDFARRRFGRPRPPADIQRRGGVWADIYERLYVERQPEQYVIDALLARTNLRLADIQVAIREVRALHHDPQRVLGPIPIQDDPDQETGAVVIPDPRAMPEARLQQQWYEDIVFWISRLLHPPAPKTEAGTADEIREADPASDALCDGITDNDFLLLKMHYVNQWSLAVCARVLERPEHETRRRHRHLLKVLGERLPSSGALGAELPDLAD